MSELIEKELSYKIVGILFEIHKELGGGYQEKYYQRAVAQALESNGLKYEEQVKVPLIFKEKSIGRYFLDFLIGEKVILELKVGTQIYTRDVKQVLAYLKSTNVELGIIALFSRDSLTFKRVLRGNSR